MNCPTAGLLLSLLRLQADCMLNMHPSIMPTHLVQVHALGIVCVIA
jgi:hypothetical protein